MNTAPTFPSSDSSDKRSKPLGLGFDLGINLELALDPVLHLPGFDGGECFVDLSLGHPVFLGISGGVDSIVLLDVMVKLSSAYGWRVIALHVDHGLRGATSEGDAEFVRMRAEHYGIPFLMEVGDVAALAEQAQVSVETAARQFRYACFARMMRSVGEDPVGEYPLFLAHHANDQAETALFNLCRGSASLKAMRPVHAIEIEGFSLSLRRPFLGVAKQDLIRYAEVHNLPWREDATNAEPVAVRNILRNTVIPLLDETFERPVYTAVNRAVKLSRERDDALDAALIALDLIDPQGRLYLPKVHPLPPSLKRAIIHWFLSTNSVSDISTGLILRAEGLLDPNSPAVINLAQGYRLRRKEQRLFIEAPS